MRKLLSEELRFVTKRTHGLEYWSRTVRQDNIRKQPILLFHKHLEEPAVAFLRFLTVHGYCCQYDPITAVNHRKYCAAIAFSRINAILDNCIHNIESQQITILTVVSLHRLTDCYDTLGVSSSDFAPIQFKAVPVLLEERLHKSKIVYLFGIEVSAEPLILSFAERKDLHC